MDEFDFEPIEEGPDKEAHQKSMQQKLAEYKAALEEEFAREEAYEEGKLTPKEVRDKTDRILTQTVPKAVARLKHVIEHSTNDALALKASQYVIDRAMGKDGAKLVDPFAELFADLDAAKK